MFVMVIDIKYSRSVLMGEKRSILVN